MYVALLHLAHFLYLSIVFPSFSQFYCHEACECLEKLLQLAIRSLWYVYTV
jgi:hypothetical protein